MNTHIKSALCCIGAVMCCFTLVSSLGGNVPNLSTILVAGSFVGLICCVVIPLFGKNRELLVGIAATCAIWFVLAAVRLSEFGLAGFDTVTFIMNTLFIAALGAVGAYGYKFGSRLHLSGINRS